MTRFLGLRGNGLYYAAIFGVAMPAIMTLGYGQGLRGGLLTLQSLENQFHEMDVTSLSAQKITQIDDTRPSDTRFGLRFNPLFFGINSYAYNSIFAVDQLCMLCLVW
jgi:hypothetical protein